MIAKFNDKADGVLEIEETKEGISFYVYHIGEEEIGSSVTIPKSEISSMIKFLQELQLFQ